MFSQNSLSLSKQGCNQLKMPEYACMIWKHANSSNIFKIPQEILAKENLIYNFITGSLTLYVPVASTWIRNPIFIALQDVDGFYNQLGQINEIVGILEYDTSYQLSGDTGTYLSYKQNGEIAFKLRKKRDNYLFKLYTPDIGSGDGILKEIVLGVKDMLLFTIRADLEFDE